MNKFKNQCHTPRVLCILMALVLCLTQVLVNAASSSSTCNSSSSSGCTLREWLIKLQEESYSLECTLSQLEKSTTLLSKVNYSTTSMRLNQITKLKKTISNLKGEIEIINLTCSTFYGPDCNQTTPECNSKCLTCASPNICSNCTGNWDGPTCSVCKQGWNGADCNTPVCSSNCASCSAPNVCVACKPGWNGTDCTVPICDSKCISCDSPGICSNCTGNWNGLTCTLCKSGWNGTLCNIPICDSKCSNCSLPGICSSCTGNWNGTTCSVCKTGWSGADCNTPVCSSNCASCSAPNICPTCKSGWYGSDCTSNIPPILTSAQITKFTTTIMSNATLTSNKLLYKAARDGFSASTFHSKCDNKGPTIVIIKATSGAIFGGYTSVSWQSSGGFLTDNSAFIFSLVSSTYVERFTKLIFQNGYLAKQGATSNIYAIYDHSIYGPVFGYGHDFIVLDNSNTHSFSYSTPCNSYCETTMTEGTTIAKSYLAGSYNFQVQDYEVYSL